MGKKGKRYDEEFQRNAVDLLIKSRRPLRQLAEELGVSTHSLCTWRKKYASQPGPQQSLLEAENEKMRREIAELKQERDILKKSVAIFLKPQK